MRRRTASVMSGALLAIALLTACVPEPAPSPTPTGFASEDEAFSAAEATYRAYVESSNDSRTDPEVVPSPDSFLTGQALTDSLDGDSELADEGLTLIGSSELLSIRHDSWTPFTVSITACLDISGVRVLDETGADVTPPLRPDRASLAVDIIYETPQPLIATSKVGDLTC